MLNVDETFNMAQALCTSALAASYVNRLNVFFHKLKERLASLPTKFRRPALSLHIFVASHVRQYISLAVMGAKGLVHSRSVGWWRTSVAICLRNTYEA